MVLLSLNVLFLWVTALILVYFYLTRNFNYWKDRGIKGPKPIVGFGTIYGIFLKPFPELNKEITKKYGKVAGLFFGPRPFLQIADPELIKDFMIRDFHLFTDRNDLITGDPMNDRNLFNLMGEEWKKMRSIISPTFSSGKMRRMHPIIVDCVKRLDNVLERDILSKDTKEFDTKILMSNFTLDVIARCAFGTKIDTYSQEKSEFVIHSQRAFRNTWRIWTSFLLSTIAPKWILERTQIGLMDPNARDFFRSAIRSIISRRKLENTKPNDYLQLMINAMDKVEDNEEDVEEDNSDDIFRQSDDRSFNNDKQKTKLSEMDVLATSFLFFIAGFETTATTLSNLLYALAVNQKCQQKLYEEVRKYGPDFDYETIGRMPYLEACIAEILRLYTPLSGVGRMAAEEYTIGDTGITIPKGMLVSFDFVSIHHGEEYYPEPMKFKPERFLPENRDKLVPYTYMPFGMGPRNCVGMRFALMEVKTAAAYLVYKYRFFATDRTPIELKPKKFELLFAVDNVFIGSELRK